MAKTTRTRAEADAERSASTRARLLEAAFECLVELGYARTTTIEICRRAGAPRGTLLHHYGSRDALMLAAVEHVLDRRLAELDRVFARMQKKLGRETASELPVALIIDELWKVISGPTMQVWLELLVAARTDRELMKRFRAQMHEFDQRVDETYRARFDLTPEETGFDEGSLPFTFAFLNGLALDWAYKPRGEVKPVLEDFKASAEALLELRKTR